ncbi:DNA methyltransferase [Metaplanococcus flavidus]|uniref:DNA methyltransferase n=1 Tax=Metaplanococcus flavidus TaxID=569883 RepID=A0ABW3LBM5_9BACL
MECILYWHDYKYLAYEKELALKEIESLIQPEDMYVEQNTIKIVLNSNSKKENLSKLTYFSRVELGDELIIPIQAKLEKIEGNGANKRQATRYSAHGIHEYKGKFNPQVVKSLLNILKMNENSNLVDPFSGSGTTLLECSLQNINAVGLDINPLAIFIANAKQTAISTDVERIEEIGETIIQTFRNQNSIRDPQVESTAREEYLLKWFPEETFLDIEKLRRIISNSGAQVENVFFVLLSNIIRDYSLQEPGDLRIRRRKSPFPEESLIDTYEKSIKKFVNNMRYSQSVTGLNLRRNTALQFDSRDLSAQEGLLETEYFDGGITSPPYATALPYIDTQRLSLVWLGLIPPNEIMSLESHLIGSREFKNAIKKEWEEKLVNNTSDLPISIHEYCSELLNSLGEADGFRRQAVPFLLYRYFADMQLMFQNLLPYFKENAPYALIVGHNHTTLGGKRFDIDTPKLLVEIANHVGWNHKDSIEFQTYRRYGMHQKNAVQFETLIILNK